MAGDKTHKANRGARRRRDGSYVSARKPKLRGITLIDLPPPPGWCDPERFGAAPEDGLRMLAALETLPSLEPDFGDDLAAEASITIIQGVPPSNAAAEPEPDEAAPAGSLRARLHDVGEAPDIVAEEYAAYHGPVEEAEVEIIDVSGGMPDALGRPRRKGRLVTRGGD